MTVSCGFKLRNKQDFPKQLQALYIKSKTPYAPFESQLKQTLVSIGIQLAPIKENAPYTLQILSTKYSHTIPSISTNNQAQTFNYNYNVSFQLINKKNKIIIGPETVSASSQLTLQPNQVLGSNDQANALEQELQRNCVTLLLDRLSAQKTHDALRQT